MTENNDSVIKLTPEEIKELEDFLLNHNELFNDLDDEPNFVFNPITVHATFAQQTVGSAGADLSYDGNEPITLQPGEFKVIPTGVYNNPANPIDSFVTPRSGLALQGITVLNSPGLVDSAYPGEIKVILINHGNYRVDINPGNRIAQLVNITGKSLKGVEVKDKVRSGGFGSTGI